MNEQQSLVVRAHPVSPDLGKIRLRSSAGTLSDLLEQGHMNWKAAIRLWRALPEEEQRGHRLANFRREMARNEVAGKERVDHRNARRRIYRDSEFPIVSPGELVHDL